jgi:AMMECR1 domain-containing protein
VTLYKNGEIRWSAGNIKEIKDTLAEELVENTIGALSKDERFSQVKLDEVPKLKIRVDLITGRKILQEWEIKSIDPTKNGIIAIQKNYNNMAVILPNINPLLLTGEDFLWVLKEKLHVKKIEEKELILYSIETQNINNF